MDPHDSQAQLRPVLVRQRARAVPSPDPDSLIAHERGGHGQEHREGHLVRHARVARRHADRTPTGVGPPWRRARQTWRALVAQLTVLLQYSATSESGKLVAVAAFRRPDQARCPPKRMLCGMVNDCLRGHYVVNVYVG